MACRFSAPAAMPKISSRPRTCAKPWPSGIPELESDGFTITLERRAKDPAITAEMQRKATRSLRTPRAHACAASATGLFYAAQTAKQLVGSRSRERCLLHLANIHDWPVLRYRGLSDDLSRGPVDTLEFQMKLIRTLAAYKANIYSPYFEHTQQYASNPLPAPPGGSDVCGRRPRAGAYARQYHITVIPEQEAFGHLHHNLNFEQYSQLAETPHGTVLAPAQPGSLQLITQMFTELADLPGPVPAHRRGRNGRPRPGQTKAAVDGRASPRCTSTTFSRSTHPASAQPAPLFWGDIAQDSPDLLKTMPPSSNMTPSPSTWWYNPRPQGFARYIKPFTDAGFETWVAPGINNWSRVYPNWNMGMANIQQFTRDGATMGAVGQLNTIWHDDGETLASNNYFGIVFGAAQAWQGGQGSTAQFQADFGPVFHGDATGKLNQAQAEIMAAHDLLKLQAKTGDASDGLFWMDPWSKDGQNYATKIRPYTHELRLHAERALTLIAEARAAYPCSTVFMQSSSVKQAATNCHTTWRHTQRAATGAGGGWCAAPIEALRRRTVRRRLPRSASPTQSMPWNSGPAGSTSLAQIPTRRRDPRPLRQSASRSSFHRQEDHTPGHLRSCGYPGRERPAGRHRRGLLMLSRDLYAQMWLRTTAPTPCARPRALRLHRQALVRPHRPASKRGTPVRRFRRRFQVQLNSAATRTVPCRPAVHCRAGAARRGRLSASGERRAPPAPALASAPSIGSVGCSSTTEPGG